MPLLLQRARRTHGGQEKAPREAAPLVSDGIQGPPRVCSGGAAHLAALDEKCLFIYFSMVVIGFVAVLEWDALFPDRRDYLILTPLPIKAGTLFVSKVGSLCIFLVLFSVFVNALPAVLYPLFFGRGIGQAIRFILSHALSVFAGNAFINNSSPRSSESQRAGLVLLHRQNAGALPNP